MQRLRITVGAPLKRPPKHQIYDDSLMPAFLSIDPNSVDLKLKQNRTLEMEENYVHPDGLSNFVVFCTTDFSTVAKEVHVRTRRVRLIGLEVIYIIRIVFIQKHCSLYHLYHRSLCIM